MHPAANFVISKALERANAAQLSYALHKLLDSLGKLRRTLIERAIALNVLEDEICEAMCSAFQGGSEVLELFAIHTLLKEYAAPSSDELQVEFSEIRFRNSRDEVASNPVEPTMTRALLVKSQFRLQAPPNGLVLGIIESSASQELLTLTRHPGASQVLDAIVDGPTIPPRSRRALLRAIEAQFADVTDDRIGARVGARCRAAADPCIKLYCVFRVVRGPE
ncbi:hypothetical protein DFH94DRAFT_689665 [Russula ochroleuca]|uniref:Nucleolar protein 9 n=1 Tax=Russula ochroleuca TaxID=152965 RepID=A0A9P5N3J7_9AGAM|nr:hypothetical protein DFH94DRAFT_689665 [Russula ochroleuca]